MTGYSVLVSARSDGTGQLDDDAGHRLADSLADYGGSAGWGGDPSRWEARITIDAEGHREAGALAEDMIRAAAVDAGMPAWPVVHVEVTREDAQADELGRSLWPDLVSGPEAAEILGVSTQRVHVLARENAQFPKPAYVLRAGSIWVRQAVERFAETWDRKPGRPRKDAGAA